MSLFFRRVLGWSMFVGTVVVGAGVNAKAATAAEAAFTQLTTLAGEWTATSGGEVMGTIKFSVHSDGSSLMEEFVGMVTVYHRDGDSLLMTHYCGAGNQPRMKLATPTAPYTTFDFKFLDISNYNPGDSFVKDLKIEFLADGKVRESWTDKAGDGSESVMVIDLERLKK